MPSILFGFSQLNGEHFYFKQRRQIIQEIVDEAASSRVYSQESETLNMGYKPGEYKKMLHAICYTMVRKNRLEWCDIHKEWY